jgi:hypothetical protein
MKWLLVSCVLIVLAFLMLLYALISEEPPE